MAEALIEQGDPELVIYDCMDRYGAFHGGRMWRRIERTEQMVVERADVVFTTSQTIASRLNLNTIPRWPWYPTAPTLNRSRARCPLPRSNGYLACLDRSSVFMEPSEIGSITPCSND